MSSWMKYHFKSFSQLQLKSSIYYQIFPRSCKIFATVELKFICSPDLILCDQYVPAGYLQYLELDHQ